MENKLPLGLCKQVVMKLDSALADVHEIIEDEDISQEQKEWFEVVAEYIATMEAVVYNQVTAEMGEDEFIAETIDMDEIDEFPGDSNDIMNTSIE